MTLGSILELGPASASLLRGLAGQTAKRAVIFGHADGDGYLAAEQTRRNLVRAGTNVCDVVVEPQITRNYRFWEQAFQCWNFEGTDLVVAVDIMLSPRNPATSFEAISTRAASCPETMFTIVDHHPVAGLPNGPANLQLRLVEHVYQCCIGDASDLMLIAAICDRDEAAVAPLLTNVHYKRALGVRRAAADHGGLAGAPLLALLRRSSWRIVEEIAAEPAGLHRTFYGRRVAGAHPAAH